MNLKFSFFLIAVTLLLASCGSTKEIPYMVDAESIPQDVLAQAAKTSDPVIMPGDLLETLITSPNVEAVKPFNRLSSMTDIGGASSASNMSSTYYLVDDNGNINFPILGKLHLGGLAMSEAKSLIANKIYPKYLTEAPDVELHIRNFRVSVLGEVKTPGIVQANNERMTILEAIAQAGDLTIQGRRDNIMLIRTSANGTRSIQRLNLNDKNLLVSPYYNLQQNDVIYVQPNESKARSSWQVPPALTLGLSTVGLMISIATLIVTISRN
jgi:polysaccharide export outer membrane protein